MYTQFASSHCSARTSADLPVHFNMYNMFRREQAQLNLLRAQVSYQVAVAAVDHATGGLLQPYNVQIAELSQ